MSAPKHRVYLVDDDPKVLTGLSRLLRSAGYDAVPFKSALEFIRNHEPDSPGCLILDLSMPEMSGLELQGWLMAARSPLPVIFLSGRGDVPASVQAMKGGAFDFLMKPVEDATLLNAISGALVLGSEARKARAEMAILLTRLATLTPREREVLEHVVSGQLNKQVAADLGTVEKTIKVHRARVMEKMHAQSLADLVRIAERLGIGRTSSGPPTELNGVIQGPQI
jgi:FixJ family two-component response regulator